MKKLKSILVRISSHEIITLNEKGLISVGSLNRFYGDSEYDMNKCKINRCIAFKDSRKLFDKGECIFEVINDRDKSCPLDLLSMPNENLTMSSDTLKMMEVSLFIISKVRYHKFDSVFVES